MFLFFFFDFRSEITDALHSLLVGLAKEKIFGGSNVMAKQQERGAAEGWEGGKKGADAL